MPQIAQQDYIKAVATPGRQPQNDCNVLSVLAKALEAGTLFDVIIIFDDDGDFCEEKILGHTDNTVYYFDTINAEITYLNVLYTPAQYAALSAVQLEADRVTESVISDIPTFDLGGDGFIQESSTGCFICTPDGYKYAATAASGKIATISVSDELAEGDYIIIDEETAQDLIGLPLN